MAIRSYTNNTLLTQVVYDYLFAPHYVNPGETVTWDDIDPTSGLPGSGFSSKGHGTSPPSSGTYKTGDLWLNDNAAAGGFYAWVYILGQGWYPFLPISG
jgi:hypothetical protein